MTYFWAALILIAALILAMAIVYLAYSVKDAGRGIDQAIAGLDHEQKLGNYLTIQGARGVATDDLTRAILNRSLHVTKADTE